MGKTTTTTTTPVDNKGSSTSCNFRNHFGSFRKEEAHQTLYGGAVCAHFLPPPARIQRPGGPRLPPSRLQPGASQEAHPGPPHGAPWLPAPQETPHSAIVLRLPWCSPNAVLPSSGRLWSPGCTQQPPTFPQLWDRPFQRSGLEEPGDTGPTPAPSEVPTLEASPLRGQDRDKRSGFGNKKGRQATDLPGRAGPRESRAATG